VLQLHCQRLQQQATSHSSSRQPCNLKLFYNNINITVPDPSTFGIDAGMLPVEGSEVPPYTQQVLNRTKEREQDGKMVQDVLWPLLYFHGGPGCNVLLERPVIRAMRRPYADKRATQVSQVMFSLCHLLCTLLVGTHCATDLCCVSAKHKHRRCCSCSCMCAAQSCRQHSMLAPLTASAGRTSPTCS
jgi:hypothetical protein